MSAATKNIHQAILNSICDYKESDGENNGAFSLNIFINKKGYYSATCDFNENLNMTVFFYQGSDDESVHTLYDLTPSSFDLIARIADIAETNDFIIRN